jgi:hypothetical protein
MLTKKNVHDAADTLDALGIEPTQRLVRDYLRGAKLPGGSFGTLGEYMSTWKPKTEQSSAPDVPANVMHSVNVFAADAWQCAFAEADVIATAKVEEANAAVKTLQEQLKAATALTDSYAVENDVFRKEVAAIPALRTALAAAKAEAETWRRASEGRRRHSQRKPKSRRKPSQSGSAPTDKPQPSDTRSGAA